MVKQIFVNLSVADLKKTRIFWEEMGFQFNPKFSDEKSLCLILGENIYAMLLKPEFFQTFTAKNIIDAHQSVEVHNAIFVESRAQVDELLEKGIAAGGTELGEAKDHGWMYYRNLQDLDGHVWEIGFGDESQVPAEGTAV